MSRLSGSCVSLPSCIGVKLSSKLTSEANTLRTWRESLIIQQRQDSLLTEENFYDLFALLCSQILLLLELHFTFLPAGVVTRLILRFLLGDLSFDIVDTLP